MREKVNQTNQTRECQEFNMLWSRSSVHGLQIQILNLSNLKVTKETSRSQKKGYKLSKSLQKLSKLPQKVFQTPFYTLELSGTNPTHKKIQFARVQNRSQTLHLRSLPLMGPTPIGGGSTTVDPSINPSMGGH